MRSNLLLIRHAAIDGLGVRIVGRTSGVHLNEQGRSQADCLARRLAVLPLCAVYSSPRERAQETAGAIAAATGLRVVTRDELDEVNFGEWTGKTLDDLDSLEAWQRFNASRNDAGIPGGESMPQLKQRAGRVVDELRRAHPSDSIALVSHADWLRAAAAAHLGLPLDALRSFEVSPASVTVLQFDNGNARIARWNDTGDLRHAL